MSTKAKSAVSLTRRAVPSPKHRGKSAIAEMLEGRLFLSVTWQVQSDYFGTKDTVSEPQSLRGLALSSDSQNVYAGFIQGSTTAAIREVSSGVNSSLIGNDGGSPTNTYGSNPPYTAGLEAKVTTGLQPKGLATDDRGNVYAVLDTGSNALTMSWAIYNSALSQQIVSKVSTDFTAASQLNSIATAKLGGHYYVYVGWENGQIERWNVDNAASPTLDTSWGSPTHRGTLSLKSISKNAYLNGLAVDGGGTIYVAGGLQSGTSFGDALIKIPSLAASAGFLGAATHVNVGGGADGLGGFSAMDVALLGQKVYVTEYLAGDSTIGVFNASNLSSAGIITPTNPTGPSGLNATFPTGSDSGFSGIQIGSDGKIYVAEELYNFVPSTGVYTPPGGTPMTGTRIYFDRVLVSSALDTAPVIDSVTISPSSPTTNQTLTANVTSHDAEGDPVIYFYQWFKNNLAIGGETNATLDLSVAGNGDKGDSISVQVTPSDGTLTGTPVTSSPVTIVDTAPVIDSVTITPSNPTTNQTLTANVTSHDDDGDFVTYGYQWFKNNVMLSGQNGSTLDLSIAGNGDDGDSITVQVTPNDGTLNGAPVTSDPVTIGDTPPVIDSVTITPTNPTANQILTANVTSHDVNGDTVTYAYQWFKNNIAISGATSSTLNLATPGNGVVGDSITVQVTPNDGTLNGTPVTSAPVIISNPSATFSNLTPSPTIVLHTRSIKLGGAISGSVPGKSPTGVVTISLIYASGPNTGQTATSATATIGNGLFTASVTVSSLPLGNYTVQYAFAGDANYSAATATTTAVVTYSIVQSGSRIVTSGGTIALQMQLFDALKVNQSSATVAATGVAIALASTPNNTQPLPPGNGSGMFTYSSTSRSYQLNLATTGLASGNYLLYIQVAGNPVELTIQFTIK